MPARGHGTSPVTGLPYSVSSPKVAQLFNIFHPSDPISYRIEPLISPAMSSLKPQALPYKKKGLFSSVSPPGLTEIGAIVGQSVSGLFSSLSSGLSSNLLNRSLGLSSDDAAKLASSKSAADPEADCSAESDGDKALAIETLKRNSAAGLSGVDSIVAEGEVETLYSQFQKKRQVMLTKSGESVSDSNWQLEERKAKRLRREEAKVRALNRNGRVDFCIQE